MDPCEHQGLLCHPEAQCVEMFIGGWQCMCNDGFAGDGEQNCEGIHLIAMPMYAQSTCEIF